MAKREIIGRALEYGLEAGGGALAGFVEGKYPGKTLWKDGPGLGVGIAAAGLALGIFGVGGKWGRMAGDLGAGAAAFEIGKAVASKTTPAATSATSGVGAAPRGLPRAGNRATQADIRQALRDLAAV